MAVTITALGAAIVSAPASASVTTRGGVHYVRVPVTVKPHSFATRVAACPKHTKVLGGGEDASTGYGTIDLRQTYPADLGDANSTPEDGWGVVVFNQSGSKAPISVVAACGKTKVGYVHKKVHLIGSDVSQEHDVSCPADQYAVSGGVRGKKQLLYMETTFPYGSTTPDPRWGSYFSSHNEASTPTAYAVCVHHAPFMAGFGQQDVPKAMDEDGGSAVCPAHTAVYGGGVSTNAGPNW